jgi:hypothetical protein
MKKSFLLWAAVSVMVLTVLVPSIASAQSADETALRQLRNGNT